MMKFFVKMQNKLQSEDGQGLVEYALILVLVSIIAIVTLAILGTDVRDVFTDISTAVTQRPQ